MGEKRGEEKRKGEKFGAGEEVWWARRKKKGRREKEREGGGYVGCGEKKEEIKNKNKK